MTKLPAQNFDFMPNYLEFEEPIKELNEQLEEADKIAKKTGVDAGTFKKDLKKKIRETTKKIYSNLTPWQKVQLSRHPDRPYTLAYIEAITEGNFIELHGDRGVRDDKAMIGGLGTVNGRSVMFVGSAKRCKYQTKTIQKFRNGES